MTRAERSAMRAGLTTRTTGGQAAPVVTASTDASVVGAQYRRMAAHAYKRSRRYPVGSAGRAELECKWYELTRQADLKMREAMRPAHTLAEKIADAQDRAGI